MKKYKINEIFYSIQGEGFHTGTPAIFIRFAGCNLSCEFCDTEFKEFKELSQVDILAQINLFLRCDTIVLTGGEPAMQVDADFISFFKNQGKKIHIETNGTIALPSNWFDWITVSPKSSPIDLKQRWGDELKVLYFEEGCKEEYRALAFHHFYLQPVCYEDNPDKSALILENTILYIKYNPKWKLSVQLHKLINIR